MEKRVLLCDDEVHILRATQFKISRAGYEVQTVSDGQAALEAVQSFRPDILVTDYQMPRLDGLQLVQKLREDPETRHLPVIMLTGKGMELSHKELRDKWGVSHVIGKPFSPREVLARIEELLAATADQGASATAAALATDDAVEEPV